MSAWNSLSFQDYLASVPPSSPPALLPQQLGRQVSQGEPLTLESELVSGHCKSVSSWQLPCSSRANAHTQGGGLFAVAHTAPLRNLSLGHSTAVKCIAGLGGDWSQNIARQGGGWPGAQPGRPSSRDQRR